MLFRPLFALISGLMLLAGEPIVIDGLFSEWADVPIALTDPADAPDAPIDIGEVRISHDESYVHLFADLSRPVCVQQLEGMLLIVLDVDGDAKTGQDIHGLAGTDLIVTLSPLSRSHGQERHQGVGIASMTYTPDPADPDANPLNPYDVGFTFAPTYASSKFEFRLHRNVTLPQTPATFTGNTLHVKLVFTDFAGKVLDETAVIEHALTVAPAPIDAEPYGDITSADPLAKTDAKQLRVMSFNGEYGKILDDPDRLGRVLRALKPDVILFQELTEKTQATDVESVMNTQAPPPEDRWYVMIGEGGGNLRCGVATYLPVTPVEALRIVSFPDNPARQLRQVSALIEHQGHHLLATSLHLRCCGGPTGPEEESRIVETTQLRQIIDAQRDVLKLDGLVMAGDFNLVGTRGPLETLCKNGDFDGTDLTPAQPYKLDHRSNATWTDRTQPFVPGRLDYVVFTDSSMLIMKQFVFDTADLAPAWRQHDNLQAEDSAMLSDHRPVVVDLMWKPDVPVHKDESMPLKSATKD